MFQFKLKQTRVIIANDEATHKEDCVAEMMKGTFLWFSSSERGKWMKTATKSFLIEKKKI